MKHKSKTQAWDFVEELDHFMIAPLVDMVAQDRPPTPLETEVNYRSRLKNQFKQSLLQHQKHLQLGIETLIFHKKWPRDERMQKALELFDNPAKRKKIVCIGMTLQEHLAFKDEELIDFYAEAVELFSKGAYHEASYIFLLLTQLNPSVASFWSALAAAEEKIHHLEGAIYAYLVAAHLDTETLTPIIQAAKCLLLLHKVGEAKHILQYAVENGGKNELLKEGLEKAQEMLRVL